jgi:hypothetical protein
MYDLHPTRIAEFVENVPPEKMESTLDRFYSLYVKQNTRK